MATNNTGKRSRTSSQPATPRAAALTGLLPFERNQFKSALPTRLKVDEIVDQTLRSIGQAWSSSDRGLYTQLTYGVLRHWHQLTWLLWLQTQAVTPTVVDCQRQSQWKSLKAFDPRVRLCIKLGLYQLAFLDQVPDYAAIDTSVELTRQFRLPAQAARFVNGVLRGFLEQQESDIIQQLIHQPELFQIWPSWWVQTLSDHYEADDLRAMATASLEPPVTAIRINTLKTPINHYLACLKDQDVPFEPVATPATSRSEENSPQPEHMPSENMTELILLPGYSGSPTELPGFSEGWLYVQDPSSALVARWVNPQPGERILDACAAPGSKTTHMAMLMKNQGKIIALDPSEARLKRLSENLARLGVTCVDLVKSPVEGYQPGSPTVCTNVLTNQPPVELASYQAVPCFDRILVDAPCSGTGTLRRHPDIAVQLRSDALSEHPPQQRKILESVVPWLKPGGSLVYSTCSIDPRENRELIASFLADHPELTLQRDSQRLITPTHDGFYLCEMTLKD